MVRKQAMMEWLAQAHVGGSREDMVQHRALGKQRLERDREEGGNKRDFTFSRIFFFM